MPFWPVIGDGVDATRVNPTSAAAAETSSRTRAWIAGSRAEVADEPSRRAHQRLLREFLSEHVADGRPLRAYDVWERNTLGRASEAAS